MRDVWDQSPTTTRVVVVAAIASMVCGLGMLCVFGLGLLGVLPASVSPTPAVSGDSNQPPTAVIIGPTQAEVGQSVAFSARESTAAEGSHPVAFGWTFGDGTTASGVDVSHIYANPGLYEVSLTVTDDKGWSDVAVQQVQIGVGQPAAPPAEATTPISEPPPATPAPDPTAAVPGTAPPEATTPAPETTPTEATTPSPEATTPAPEATPTSGPGAGEAPTALIIAVVVDGEFQAIFPPGQIIVAKPGQPIEFDGAGSQPGSSEILSYDWTFGDGVSGATGPMVSFAYASPGNYTASLTVTDANGMSDTATAEVQVAGEAQPTTD